MWGLHDEAQDQISLSPVNFIFSFILAIKWLSGALWIIWLFLCSPSPNQCSVNLLLKLDWKTTASALSYANLIGAFCVL